MPPGRETSMTSELPDFRNLQPVVEASAFAASSTSSGSVRVDDGINLITCSKAKIIISGYESELYNTALVGWHKDTTMSQTTSAEMARETIWMNYEPDGQMKLF